MKNREIYAKDPADLKLANNGVAKVTESDGAEDISILRSELATFVCKGQYEKGMRTILSAYMGDLGQPDIRCVWVSGFYGSGKSHFVKMLRALWTDRQFVDTGDSARGLVRLPEDIRTLLVELSTAGKRFGGLHAAAGTLGSGAGSVRLALLAIVFRSVGLPEQLDRASFLMWLRDNGVLQQVKDSVESDGGTWDAELARFVMSSRIHVAVGKHLPAWSNATALSEHLMAQFPIQSEITDAEMTESVRFALAPGGKPFPCTLIALDEVQQFIGDNELRANQVQEVTESVCKKFNGRLLFVATGQNAITDTRQLQKLQARFNVQVQLSDADVDTVIREIVLLKKPSAVAELSARLTKAIGEITRQLSGTRLATQPGDEAMLVPDYPLLPVRRRFWERALRAVDEGGVVGQLRNQLQAVFAAVREGAEREVGTVVGADFLYFNLATRLIQTETVPRNTYDRIATLYPSTDPDSRLKARLLALAYLIGRLLRGPGADDGVRATPDVFADLLVEDLAAGSADLRKRIPGLLEQLVVDGDLMQVDEEFRIQSTESRLWDGEYKAALKSWQEGADKLSAARADMLQLATRALLKPISLRQGVSKVSRELTLSFGMDPPKTDAGSVPVWVQGLGGETWVSVQNDAAGAGEKSPMVLVWLPTKGAGDFSAALASLRASGETLDRRGAPTTQPGVEARSAIETRRANAQLKVDAIVADLLAGARVLQAGGEEVTANTLADAVKAAAQNSLVRLFPEFSKADNPKWDQVVLQAKAGQTQALEQVGHTGDPDKHPVCLEILRYIVAGKKGSEIRAHFEGMTYGWPRDAVDGAIFTLLLTEHLRCAANGQPVLLSALQRTMVGFHEFRAETIVIAGKQRGTVRKLMADAGVACVAGQEAAELPKYFEFMRDLAAQAGGQAPRPEAPSVAHIQEIAKFGGNDLINRVYNPATCAQPPSTANAPASPVECSCVRCTLAKNRLDWLETATAISSRLPEWSRLESLLVHSSGLDGYSVMRNERDAIVAHRSLLATPDPVPGLADGLAAKLRAGLLAEHIAWEIVWTTEMHQLETFESWVVLTPEQCAGILAHHRIANVSKLNVASEKALLESLAARGLDAWKRETKSLPARFHDARLEAARLAEPETRQALLPKRTLKTKADLELWLSDARKELLVQIELGPLVV